MWDCFQLHIAVDTVLRLCHAVETPVQIHDVLQRIGQRAPVFLFHADVEGLIEIALGCAVVVEEEVDASNVVVALVDGLISHFHSLLEITECRREAETQLSDAAGIVQGVGTDALLILRHAHVVTIAHDGETDHCLVELPFLQEVVAPLIELLGRLVHILLVEP